MQASKVSKVFIALALSAGFASASFAESVVSPAVAAKANVAAPAVVVAEKKADVVALGAEPAKAEVAKAEVVKKDAAKPAAKHGKAHPAEVVAPAAK